MESPFSIQPVGIVRGPLFDLPDIRDSIISDLTSRSVLASSDYERVLQETLYAERLRISRAGSPYQPRNWMTFSRRKADQEFLRSLSSGLQLQPSQVDRRGLYETTVKAHLNEIAGFFDPSVYRLATQLVPLFLNTLLNAAGVEQLSSSSLVDRLSGRLQIFGEVERLRELSDRYTVLLVPTHQSNIDSILIGYLIYLMKLPPFCYGAGLNLFSNPILGYFMSRLGAYTVDRQKTHSLYKGLLKEYSTEILARGMHSIFFPGGGRSRDGSIESKIKMGLLGTGLQAQLRHWIKGDTHRRIVVVPMVMSYHFVLEAASLIDDYLRAAGKSYYFSPRSEHEILPLRSLQYFYKFFRSESNIVVRLGKPMDVFGNELDEAGHSIGANGRIIDPLSWVKTRGEIKEVVDRDQEYTRRLAGRISEAFHENHTVLGSQFVAWVYFQCLRNLYREFNLGRLLSLTHSQRRVPVEAFLLELEKQREWLRKLARARKLVLSNEVEYFEAKALMRRGILQLGPFHGAQVLVEEGDVVLSRNLNLLYYYRNRLAGFRDRLEGLDDESKGILV